MEHTKEPWSVDPKASLRVASGDVTVCSCGTADSIRDQWENNARRIVACVNACKRFSTELLEAAAACGGVPAEPTDELIKCRKQRDELIADMKKIVAKCNLDMLHHDGGVGGHAYLIWTMADAALAKIEGEKHE